MLDLGVKEIVDISDDCSSEAPCVQALQACHCNTRVRFKFGDVKIELFRHQQSFSNGLSFYYFKEKLL
ncbi:hypothetical protein Scep_006893 [Stephania cephalantha]|uniref:Uncharacterized protein n=1 Tax=Stephania cephalantha TaxID=152367 RepID=A0AAP0PPH4_9MAGN